MADEHTCDDCGKRLATAGGLEIHREMAHSVPTVMPEPISAAAPAPAALRPTNLTRSASADRESDDATSRDGAEPLAWVLVILLLLGSVAAAVHNPRGPVQTTATAVSASSTAESTPAGGERARSLADPSPAVSGCNAALAPVTPAATESRVDIARLVVEGSVAPLPVPGHDRPNVTDVDRFATAAEYVAGTRTVDPGLWHARMEADGFSGSAKAWYEVGPTSYGAEVLSFASPAAAATFHRATTDAACASGLVHEARTLPLPGGISYLYALPGASPYRASFLAGESVVSLRICQCVSAPDHHLLVDQWADAVARQVGAR